MTYDAHKNFGFTVVALAPSTPTAGTTFSVLNANAVNLPDPASVGAYNLTVTAANQQPLSTNSEIIRITAKGAADSGGAGFTQFTISRLAENNAGGSMTARSIQVGDWISHSITAKTLTDVETNKLDRDGSQAMTGTLTFASLTTTQQNALTPVNGMTHYNSTKALFQKYENSQWVDISKSPATKVIAPSGSGYAADYYTLGSGDDVQIQAAIAAVASLGSGTVLIKRGTYVAAAKMTLPSNVTVKGEGSNTIMQSGNSLNDSIFVNSGSVNIHVLDLAIDMNASNNTTITSKGGVKLTGVSDSSIERVKVTNMRHVQGQGNVGVSLTTASNSSIKNCYIYSVGDYGIASNGLLQCQIVDNYIQNPAGHGIDMELGTIGGANERNIGCNISRNIIFYDASETLTNQDGIKIGRSDGCLIEDNIIYNTLGNAKLGIYYAEDTGATGDNNFDRGNVITGNTIYGVGQGMWILGSLNDVISNNTITLIPTAQYGMQITVSTDTDNPTNSEELQITGNTIVQQTNTVQTAGAGIAIYGNAHHINISGNNIFNIANTGIQVIFGSSNINITGNIIRDCMASAVHLGCSFGAGGRSATGTSFNNVSGNTISGSSRITNATYNDIEIWGASTYNTVSSNTINCPNANKSQFGVHEDATSGTPDSNNIANNTIQGVTNGVQTVQITGPNTIASGNSNGGRGFEVIQMATAGAQIRLFDNRSGISNPIKTIRSRGGNFQIIDNSGNNSLITISDSGRIGSYNITSPTAWLHLPAGLATASGSPLKFTSGVSLTTPEAGTMEFDGTSFYLTPSSTRKTIGYTDMSNLVPVASFSMNSQKIINLLDPTGAQDGATKNYVDAVAQGLSVKPSAIVATTTTLPTYTYLSSVITMTATGVVAIDGHNLALNDVILVKNETSTNQPNNGLYTVTTAGAIGVALILTRHTSMDASTEFSGGFVFVESGTVNTAAGFVCTNTGSVIVGTTNISFTQFSGAGEITAGNSLTKTGNTLDTIQDIRTSASPVFSGLTLSALTVTGQTIISGNASSAFSVGLNGSTNPTLNIDASTALSATGLNIKSAAAAGGVALSALSSGTDENITFDAKGAGTITLGGVSTGNIVLSRATILSKNLAITIADTSNVQALTLNQNDVTNNPTALLISNLGTGFSLDVQGPNIAPGTAANLRIFATNTQAADIGGSLGFYGYITGTSTSQIHGAITAKKENATSANTRSYMRFDVSGSERLRIDSNGKVGIGGAGPSNSQYTYNLSFVTTAARTIGMERMTTAATAGTSLTISAQGAKSGGTDLAGGSLILQPGIPTGVGRSVVSIQGVTPALSTGTGDNSTFLDRTIVGAFKALTNNSAINLVNCTLASNTVISVVVRYAIEVFDGTNLQLETGEIMVQCANKGGVFSGNTVTQIANDGITLGKPKQILTSGTLGTAAACVWAITGANPAVLSVNANSSLTPSTGYPRITYTLENYTQQSVSIL